jgi:hypothetical protein
MESFSVVVETFSFQYSRDPKLTVQPEFDVMSFEVIDKNLVLFIILFFVTQNEKYLQKK